MLCLYNCIINEGGGFSQNCLETELNQFCLKYNKQEIKALGGGGDSLIKLGTNVRREQNFDWAKFFRENIIQGENVGSRN